MTTQITDRSGNLSDRNKKQTHGHKAIRNHCTSEHIRGNWRSIFLISIRLIRLTPKSLNFDWFLHWSWKTLIFIGWSSISLTFSSLTSNKVIEVSVALEAPNKAENFWVLNHFEVQGAVIRSWVFEIPDVSAFISNLRLLQSVIIKAL